MTLYLTVLTVYDVLAGAPLTLYFSNGLGFNSGAADVPADTHFSPRLMEPINVLRDMFSSGRTKGRSKVASGVALLNNADGGLDDFEHYAVDGRTIQQYRGTDDAAFPSGFTEVWSGTMRDAEFDGDTVTLRLRDAQAELETPYQTTKYAGDNVLPAGLEGVADIEGKPKPIARGVVRNVAPVLVNTTKLIYQVNDGAVASIDSVFDSGVELSSLTAPDFTKIADSPAGHNTVIYHPQSQTYVALGSGFLNDGSRMWRSLDGIIWTPSLNPAPGDSSYQLWALAADPVHGLIIAGGTGTGTIEIAVSNDGITWTRITGHGIANAINDLVAGVGEGASGATRWLAACDSATIETSDDGGLTWTARTPAGFTGGEQIQACAYGAGVFVVAGDAGRLESSADGITWTARTSQFGSTKIWAVTWSEDLSLFVAVGGAGKISTSPDGTTWTSRTSGSSATLGDVAYLPLIGHLAALELAGDELRISRDGTTWSDATPSGTKDMGSRRPHIAEHGVIGRAIITFATTGEIHETLPWQGVAYTSESDILDDALAPPPGAVGVYLAGGLFRLGSSPSGQITADVTVEATAADRTAGQLWGDVLTAAGKPNMINLVTDNDISGWADDGTPVVVTGVDDPLGGTDAYTVEDDNAAGFEAVKEPVTLTGDGVKTCEFIVREHTMASAGEQGVRLWDNSANAQRFECGITAWVDGKPTLDVTVGTLHSLTAVGGGWWRIRGISTSCTAANGHQVFFRPATTGSATGILGCYRARVYDSATFTDNWEWMDVERIDNENPAELGDFRDGEVKTAEVLSRIADSVGAGWWVDRLGLYRIGVLKDPQLTTNLLTFPRTLDDASWVNVRTTDAADTALAPNGTTTADSLIEDNTGGATHYVRQEIAKAAAALEYVFDVALKADTREDVQLWIWGTNAGIANRVAAEFDLSDGTIFSAAAAAGSGWTALGSEIFDIGNGWYRCRIKAKSNSAEVLNVGVFLADSPGGVFYNGDGSSGLYVWDAKILTNIALEITADDMVSPLVALPAALPAFKHKLRYRKNYTVQDTGLVGGVSDVRRGVLANEFQEVEAIDATVQTAFLLSDEEKEDSAIDSRADASTEVARRQELRGVRRRRYATTIPLNDDTETLDLGQYVRITHPRYGLAVGREFVVIQVDPDGADETLGLELWG